MNRPIPEFCEYVEKIEGARYRPPDTPEWEDEEWPYTTTKMIYCKFSPRWAVSVNELSPLFCCTTHSKMMQKQWSHAFQFSSQPLNLVAA